MTPGTRMRDTARVLAAYTAAADTFDDLPFWHEFGRRTVAAAALAPGDRVLDLCCGTGASALPAAAVVGATGSVLGVDIVPALLERARASAEARRLPQVQFHRADIERIDFTKSRFDAVLCVFGLFFAEDMAGLLRRAWSWLFPRGRLAITVWGEVVLAPGEALFWEAVRREDAGLDHVSPAGRLTTPDAVTALFAEAGLPAPAVHVERWRMPLASPENFWPVILGTSNRGVWEALTPEARDRVRASVEGGLREHAVTGLDSEAIVAVARR